MSSDALSWAMKQAVPSSAKFVLVVMSDQVTTDLCFMTCATIAARTCQDRKTVLTNLARLQEWGLIEDTGERRGRTGSVPVYRLRIGEDLFDNAPHPSDTKSGTGTKTGTASEAVPILDGSGTVFPAKQSQKRDTDTKQTRNYPSRAPHARAHEESAEPCPPPEREPSPTGVACHAMREAGMPLNRLNPSHPELLLALEAGVTAKELADVTREVATRGGAPPNMAYVCRTAMGRRRDAANHGTSSDASPADQNRRPPGRPPSARPSAIQRAVAGIVARRERDETATAHAVEPAG